MTALDQQPAIAWSWLLPEDESRFATLPAATGTDEVHPGTVTAALTRAGGEAAAILLLIGWSPLALELMAADPLLSQRSVVWAMAEGDLARAQACALQLRTVLPRLLIAAYASPGDLPRIVSRLPLLGWSAAVLSDDPALSGQIPLLRNWSLSTTSTPPARRLMECRNFLARETRLGDAVALTSWRGAWTGRTALCLAGGPGLDRDLPFVRQWMDRCVVIAADVVATRLARLGIKIDFIVNADAHADVATRVERPEDPATVLVMPLTGHPELDLRCPRRSYEGADPLAGHVLGREHAYSHGTNVGSCTVGLAEYLDCSEIVLVGHDLSFAADAYYSTCVGDHAALQQSSLAHANRFSEVSVPGNGGGKVRTTHAFMHGISDLSTFGASFVRRGGRVMNCNCNAGTGAAIPFTIAIPSGWQPAGAGVAPRPGCGRRLAETWRHAPTPLVPLAGQACAAYVRAMRALPTEPADFLRCALDLDHAAEPDLGQTLLAPFCRPALLHLACHVMSRSGQGSRSLAQAMRLAVLDAVERSHQVVQQTLAGIWSPALPARSPADAVAESLAARAPVLPSGDLTATLLPLILRDLRDARTIDPGFPSPPASGVIDGVHLLSALAGTAPQAQMMELLCLASLLPADDPLRYVEAVAAEHGVVAPPSEGVAGQAVAAILALQREDIAVAERSRCALTWPAAIPYLIEALARGGPAHHQELGRLVNAGDIACDDATAARLIAAGIAVPSPQAGPQAVLARCERLVSSGLWAEAEAAAVGLPLLHPLGSTGIALRCRCAFHRGGEDALMALINDLPDQSMRVAALHGFLVAEEGCIQAIVRLAELGIAPVPAAVLATSLRSCLAISTERATRHAICQVHIALLRATRAAGPPPGEALELNETLDLAERALAIVSS